MNNNNIASVNIKKKSIYYANERERLTPPSLYYVCRIFNNDSGG